MKGRSLIGQGMVEIAIGVGCVTAVSLMILGGLGNAGADVMRQGLVNTSGSNDKLVDVAPVYTQGINGLTRITWNSR